MTTTRREFVTLGAIGLFGAKQLFGQQVVRVFGTEQGAMPILSVGYWDGLISGQGAATPAARIVNAQGAGADSRFNRAGALVTTYGYWRAPQNRALPVSLSLIAFYPQADPATKQKTPFIAWNVVVRETRVDGSLRSKFVVPVDESNHIQLAIDKHPLQNGVAHGLDQAQALIKDPSTIVDLGEAVALRRGFYFIALRDKDAQDLPDWGSIRVSQLRSTDRVAPDGDGILTGPNGNPVTFDYIVLLIEPYGVSGGRDSSKADHQG